MATTIDAYCHIGLPRFSTAEDALTVFDQAGVSQGVFVLGPLVPDYPTLLSAMERYSGRIRGIGIPFGETAAQIEESVNLQLRAGVLGLRVEPKELLAYPRILELLGEEGRWLYGINVLASDELVQTLVRWLEKYPQARLAAPHFLQPSPLFNGNIEETLVRALLSHPHFYPIFSRHGGKGSQMAYPHPDLLPWVDQVLALTGWSRVMWGSEYPVYYWRNETMVSCQQWLAQLKPDTSPAELAAFLGANAQRLIFDIPPPAREAVSMPAWVEAQFNRQRTIPLFQQSGLDLPMLTYEKLHHRFIAALRKNPELTFARFIVDCLDESPA